MPLYRHESGEQIRTVPGSHDDERLRALAAQVGSGWEEIPDGTTPPPLAYAIVRSINGEQPNPATGNVTLTPADISALDQAGGDARYAPVALPPRAALKRSWPQLTMISAVQAGHAWVAGGTYGSANLNDTTDYALGSQSVQLVTDGAGAQGFVELGSLTLDLTGRGLLLWVKVTGPSIANLLYVAVDIGDATLANRWRAWVHNADGIAGPIKVGEWAPMMIPWADFESGKTGSPNRAAITKIRVLAGDTGGQAMTVRLGGVASFVDSSPAYPNGVVSLTFDDSFAAHYTAALPKMSTLGYRGTLYPIVGRLDQASYLTTAQVRALQDVHGWEIGAHASSDATHVDSTARTDQQWADELRTLRAWQTTTGVQSSSYAYPLGRFNAANAAVAAKHYASARGTWTRPVSTVTNLPHRLGAIPLGTSLTLAAAKARVDQALAGKGWLTFVVHNLVAANPSVINDWLISDFNALVDYIATKTIAVAPVGEVIAATS